MSDPNEKSVRAVVAFACQQLELHELAAQYNAVRNGFDPKQVDGYDKISYLYTERDGTKMHADTRAAFEYVVGGWFRDVGLVQP